MAVCSNCRRDTLIFVGKDSDILPPPPGTNWFPAPRHWDIYRCTNCGHEERVRTDTRIPFPSLRGSTFGPRGCGELVAGIYMVANGIACLTVAALNFRQNISFAIVFFLLALGSFYIAFALLFSKTKEDGLRKIKAMRPIVLILIVIACGLYFLLQGR